ncbi:hypothetical protein Q5P01_011024 [Channa striata]|uniref:Transcription elongation factor A (SII), 3 n=1 Tax=Channa striata TaxID=64152 RepID=A0AA88MSL7_CHASR|nr:hypothetical protein Q5P01_011024 [Channa striata]
MTREEDLIRIAKKLDKMVSRNNTEGALDLLKELKGFNMTLKLLQETRIGMSVNGIRKHCTDEEVTALAKVLIKDWKRLLDSGHSHSDKSSEMKNGLDSSKTAASPNRSPSESQSRKDSCDSKPSQPVKCHSTDSKPDRRESTDSKKSSSPPAKKLAGERRESHGSKAGPPQRKPSTDSIERKGKTEAPKTPTTPTSPMSPGFSSAGGPLSPHLATGDSVRDKCIEMLAAALRTDNDFKDFGANCDSMAAEIEDHIL